jgi:RND family efflux transporter MFP subunit
MGIAALLAACLLFVAGAAVDDLMRMADEPAVYIPMSVKVRAKPLYRQRQFPVEIRPWLQARVPAAIAGRVLEVNAKPGQAVNKDDPLLRLDDGTARIALDLAIARHMETSRLLVETERLLKTNAVPESAYEAALAQVRTSRLELDAARDHFENHTIRAPFTGTLDGIFVDVGDAVEPNQQVARVVDLGKLRAYMDVAESDLSAFRRGSQIPIRLKAFPDGGLSSRVEFVSRSADPGTGLFRIESILDNEKNQLPGGITGTAEVSVLAYPRGPVVPAEAVEFAVGDAVVFKERSGRAVPSLIEVGPEIDGFFPVFSGLSEGEKLVIH